MEAAKVLGEEMTAIPNPQERVRMAFTRLTGKEPTKQELALLVDLSNKEYEIFSAHPDKSIGWLQAGSHSVSKDLDPLLVAANAVVASVILNGDVTLMKR